MERHVDWLLAEPLPTANSSGTLLCDTVRDHMYSYGIVYRLSTNATRRAALASRVAAELTLVPEAIFIIKRPQSV